MNKLLREILTPAEKAAWFKPPVGKAKGDDKNLDIMFRYAVEAGFKGTKEEYRDKVFKGGKHGNKNRV